MMSHGSNLLLSALHPETRASLLKHAASVELPFGTVMLHAGGAPRYAYFLLSGLASVVVSIPDGASAEVGMAGTEGVIGSAHLLGPVNIPSHCVMQLTGAGLRIPFLQLQAAFDSSAELRPLILALLQEQFAAMSQIAACNRLHTAEQRLARWLLMAEDRAHQEVLKFTHEYLAQMIATQRSTVTVVASELQDRNIIEYSRGNIRILNRAGLESAACSCYHTIRNLNTGILPYAGSHAGEANGDGHSPSTSSAGTS